MVAQGLFKCIEKLGKDFPSELKDWTSSGKDRQQEHDHASILSDLIERLEKVEQVRSSQNQLPYPQVRSTHPKTAWKREC